MAPPPPFSANSGGTSGLFWAAIFFPGVFACCRFFLTFSFSTLGNQSHPPLLLLCNDVARKAYCLTPCPSCLRRVTVESVPGFPLALQVPPTPQVPLASMFGHLPRLPLGLGPGSALSDTVLGPCAWKTRCRCADTRIAILGGKWARACDSVWVFLEPCGASARGLVLPVARKDRNAGPVSEPSPLTCVHPRKPLALRLGPDRTL